MAASLPTPPPENQNTFEIPAHPETIPEEEEPQEGAEDQSNGHAVAEKMEALAVSAQNKPANGVVEHKTDTVTASNINDKAPSSIPDDAAIESRKQEHKSDVAHLAPSTATSTTAPKKPGLTQRLTRMFSQSTKPGANLEPPRSESRSAISTPESEVGDPVIMKSKPPSSGTASKPMSRQPSHTEVQHANPLERRTSNAGIKKENIASLRFVMKPDGDHEHNLRNTRRQEKLSNMLRDMLGRKKHDEDAPEPELSLMSSWVDQLKSEREKLAADRKGGPAATTTLVEKYGKCQEIVGRGAFGIVRVSHKPDPNDSKVEQLYAVKEFRRRPSESAKKYQKRLTSEFCISSSLRHPNVIHTLDLLQDAKGDYCEVMEYCAGGDLYTLVLAAGKLETAEADCYFKQLMRGVEYLHEMGVAHRDLKPENLLLTKHGALKITDFGNGECFRMAWEKEAHMTAGLCGSAPYIAPEEYIDQEFDPRAVDVWATGVIYVAMRTGRHLWRVAKKDEDEFFARYLEGRRDEDGYQPIESLHRARCRNVIYSILDPNPSRRITATQVLKSEWGREMRLCKAGEEGF